MSSSFGRHITPLAKKWRALYLIALPSVLLALAFIPPGRFSHGWPFPTSCGVVTGLPCIFCGTTRAVHYLLQGDFERALYFNWLAYPLVTAALMLALLNALELLCARNFLSRLPRPHLTRKSLGGLAAGLLLLWGFQIYLAVSRHKSELLNPHGPLYSLVVR
ncbi:hypothetical protein BH20VER3_BH20VER3_01660 [soil metagenome]